MQIVSICQVMGWGYQKYMEQPEWFIDLLQDKLQIDSKNIRDQINRAKRK